MHVCRCGNSCANGLRHWCVLKRRTRMTLSKWSHVTTVYRTTSNLLIWRHRHRHHHQQQPRHQLGRASVQWNVCWVQSTTCWRRECVVTPSYVLRPTNINRWCVSGLLLQQSSTASVSSSSASRSSSPVSSSQCCSCFMHRNLGTA